MVYLCFGLLTFWAHLWYVFLLLVLCICMHVFIRVMLTGIVLNKYIMLDHYMLLIMCILKKSLICGTWKGLGDVKLSWLRLVHILNYEIMICPIMKLFIHFNVHYISFIYLFICPWCEVMSHEQSEEM